MEQRVNISSFVLSWAKLLKKHSNRWKTFTVTSVYPVHKYSTGLLDFVMAVKILKTMNAHRGQEPRGMKKTLRKSAKFCALIAQYYLGVLKRLWDRIHRVRPEYKEVGSWFLLHDNAPSHKVLIVREFLDKKSIITLDHPPYSPDLSPCDFWLFPKLKLWRGSPTKYDSYHPEGFDRHPQGYSGPRVPDMLRQILWSLTTLYWLRGGLFWINMLKEMNYKASFSLI